MAVTVCEPTSVSASGQRALAGLVSHHHADQLAAAADDSRIAAKSLDQCWLVVDAKLAVEPSLHRFSSPCLTLFAPEASRGWMA